MNPETGLKVQHYDLNKGRYGVTVSIGKSYKSRSEEGADELGQLFQAQPQLFPILGDIYLKFRDFPGHLEAASRIKKLLPPPLQEQTNQPNPQQLQQQLEQAGQMVDQLTKALDEKTHEAEAKLPELQMEDQRAAADREAKLQIERMKNETQLAVATMKIQADEAAAIFAVEVGRVGTDSKHRFDAIKQASDQHHQQQLAMQGAMAQQDQAEQVAIQASDQSMQDFQQNSVMSASPVEPGLRPSIEETPPSLPPLPPLPPEQV
tara:strand:+ start:69 stop:857 length:789 start_codon:yes stop_codon:yes gene_type:complete